jgi:hypothetical protein
MALALFNRFRKTPKVTDPLNRVDLCFVVDSTGSMQPFINAAQQQLIDVIQKLSDTNSIDLQIGLVEYRDHPPQDNSFVTRINPLIGDLKKMRKIVSGLEADGGGDASEAVYDGVFEACTNMEWREFSCRFVLLVGDAPPHGAVNRVEVASDGRAVRRRTRSISDAWLDGCPCGLEVNAVTAAAENNRVTIHALLMENTPITVESFAEIARATGGHFALATVADDVVSRIISVLDAEFRNMEFDSRILETIRKLGCIDVQAAANDASCPRLLAASSIARLGRRGFLQELALS